MMLICVSVAGHHSIFPGEFLMKKLTLAVAVTALVSGCGQTGTDESVVVDAADDAATGMDPAPAGADFASDDERILYALGIALAENIAELNLTEQEFVHVAAGMRDSVSGVEPRVEMDTWGPQIQIFANERINAAVVAAAAEEKELSAAFAEEIAAEEGAERLESGVIFVPITQGDGASPTASDTVSVHYHGTLRDGSVFDSSVESGMPARFPLNGVIPCWTEGVQMLQVGGKAKLLCPSDTAYGDQGAGPIPPGASLLFEVELLEIE
jgi:FKBP-type peptidyl-prolyl cis-trans isomerase FkpA